MGRGKACSRMKEWVKAHKLFAGRTCPWSLGCRKGGNQVASLGQTRVELETGPRCPGHSLLHTGGRSELIKVKMKHHRQQQSVIKTL